MIEITGKYNTAKIFANELDEASEKQIYAMMSAEMFEGGKVRIMPDVHCGSGSVIGLTYKLQNKICPNIVSVDIGCGVSAYNLGKNCPNLVALDKFIHNNIPHGKNVRNDGYTDKGYIFLVSREKDFKIFNEIIGICDKLGIASDRVDNSIGTLGGGNHFIEVDFDGENYWLVIHSGSRNFGLQIANYHQKKAIEKMGKMDGLAYLEGSDAEEYYRDMEIAQKYAKLNRFTMAYQIITEGLGLAIGATVSVESVHNYINFDDGIVRKGAISAHKGESVIIPWNMRDGIVIGIGKGNEDWNNSAPHGAGRIMSRSKAKENVSLVDFEESMKGIYTTCVSKNTIDESPMAYKDYKVVKELLADSVDVTLNLRPVYNFKEGE